ncbi:MAG: DUF4282 domain-containing protein [Planctomycetota bacterium]
MLQFNCPSCRKAFRVEDSFAGKLAKCSCGQQIAVPGVSVPQSSATARLPDQPPASSWEQPEIELPSDIKTGTSSPRSTTKLGKSPASWLAILDWRFEYYLTPWIIRILWVMFLLLAFGMLLLNTLGLAWGLMPDFSNTPATPHYGRGFEEPSAPMLPIWLTARVAKIFFFIASVVGSVIGVLVTRMVLELMIVVFRIAEDIGSLKRKYAEEDNPIPLPRKAGVL